MKRSELHPLPEYFDRYINKCDDVELLEAIRTSIDEIKAAPIEKWKGLGDTVYAPGKWTVKDMLQHMIDTERIFMFRALSYARKELQLLPPFEEQDYAIAAEANNRELEDLITELVTVHESFLALYQSFNQEMLLRAGQAFRGPITVAAIGFCMPGHQRWHFDVLRERYYPLLQKEKA